MWEWALVSVWGPDLGLEPEPEPELALEQEPESDRELGPEARESGLEWASVREFQEQGPQAGLASRVEPELGLARGAG